MGAEEEGAGHHLPPQEAEVVEPPVQREGAGEEAVHFLHPGEEGEEQEARPPLEGAGEEEGLHRSVPEEAGQVVRRCCPQEEGAGVPSGSPPSCETDCQSCWVASAPHGGRGVAACWRWQGRSPS